ncbi:MAG: hypothetical protein WC969_08390 [Elusimicrobiota bacterium]
MLALLCPAASAKSTAPEKPKPPAVAPPPSQDPNPEGQKAEDEPFDRTQYPLMSIAKAVSMEPCPPNPKAKPLIKDRLFSAELVYQGSLRDTPPARYELMKRWTKQIGDPDAAPRYKKEISLSEGKRPLWLPVPEGLIEPMQADLVVGDRALIYAVFVGCVQGKPVFAIDEFETFTPEDEEADDYITRRPSSRPGGDPS